MYQFFQKSQSLPLLKKIACGAFVGSTFFRAKLEEGYIEKCMALYKDGLTEEERNIKLRVMESIWRFEGSR